MQRSLPASSALALAVLVHGGAAHAQAQMSMVAMAKQILQNVAFGSVKNELIGSLAGMGCKGSTIASLAASASAASRPRANMGGMDPAAMQRAVEMAQKQMGIQITPEQQAQMRKAMTQM